jgi:hypothetical protein
VEGNDDVHGREKQFFGVDEAVRFFYFDDVPDLVEGGFIEGTHHLDDLLLQYMIDYTLL